MPGPLKPVHQKDFSGGTNAVVNPFDAGPKQVLRATNLILDEHGSLRTVDGTLIQTTAPAAVINATSRIVLPISWQPVGGALLRLVVVTPPAPAASTLWNRGTTPWTQIGTFVSNNPTPQAAILNNTLCITDGYNPPMSVSSAGVVGTLAGLAGAQHLVNHEGFLWAWNTAAATGAVDSPSTLEQSNINDPTTWPGASQSLFISKDDGQTGQGMAVMTIAEAGISPTDTLVVFKDRSGYQITGNLGTGGSGKPSTNFANQQIKSDMGCVAPRTIEFLSGYGILRLTHKGFGLYNSVDDLLTSEEIRPYLFGRDDITGLDWPNVALSWAAQCANPPLYVAFCPTNGANMTQGFIYDLIRRAWTVVQVPFAVASVALIYEPGQLPLFLMTDATMGNIRRWFSQDQTWDGTAVSWSFRSRPVFDGSQMEWAYFRRLLLDILVSTGATISYNVTFQNMQAVGISTQTFQSNATGGIWGQSKWGQFTWGSGGVSLIGSQPTVDLDVISPSAFLDLQGNGPTRIRGLEWHLRKKSLRGTRN